MSSLRVIGDIGGTNARFAVAENGRYRDLLHVEVRKFASLHDALAEYLKGLPPASRPVSEGAIAVAGPVLGDRVALTNFAWSFSVSELKKSLGLTSLAVVNDFAATAMAVPHLPEGDRFLVGPACPQAVGPIGIIGPGTGLGMSALIPNGREWVLVAGEGGHATLPASTSGRGRDRSGPAHALGPRVGRTRAVRRWSRQYLSGALHDRWHGAGGADAG